MAFKLKDGLFRVQCKHTGCPFKSEFKVSQNIMGLAEADVEREAKKIAHDMALIKHDAIFGRQHSLTKPVIRKVGGSYVSVGGRTSSPIPGQDGFMIQRKFAKGEVILKRGEDATTICRVIKGAAYPEGNEAFQYAPGDTFGVAGLLMGQSRMVNVLASKANTVVAFYDLRELNASDPQKARELFNGALQDVFHVLTVMEHKISRLSAASKRDKKKIASLQSQLADRGPSRSGGKKK